MERTLPVSLLAVVASALIGTHAHAAWLGELRGSLESRYDDNTRLAIDDEDESSVATTGTLEGRLRRVTESSEISAILGGSYLAYSSYDGVRELDDEDIQYADLRARNQGQRLGVGLNGSVRRDVLLRTVGFIRDPIQDFEDAEGAPIIDDDVISDGGDVDAAFVDEQVRRIRTSATPYLDYQVSQLTRARLGYNYLGLDYDDDLATGLQDSESHGVSADLRRQMSAQNAARVTVGASRFETDVTDSETDSYDLTVGWEREFTPRVTGSIDVGGRRTERDDESDTGFLLRLRGIRVTETGSLLGQLEHSLRPNGFGELVETDILLARYSVALSDKWGFELGGRAHRTRQTLETNEDNDRDYVEVGPQLTWSLTEVIALGAFYRYRYIDRKDEGDASSNAVGIQLAYQPRRRF